MSCHHRYRPHGCGDWPAPSPDWYDDYGYRPRRYRDEVIVRRDDEDEYLEMERSRRRRQGGRGRQRREGDILAEEVTVASLQSRAEALRDELLRIEEDLTKLSSDPGQASEA